MLFLQQTRTYISVVNLEAENVLHCSLSQKPHLSHKSLCDKVLYIKCYVKENVQCFAYMYTFYSRQI
jgi:hypothetical protein